jgi:hypothetical protein
MRIMRPDLTLYESGRVEQYGPKGRRGYRRAVSRSARMRGVLVVCLALWCAGAQGAPAWENACRGAVQEQLRFGASALRVPETLPDPAEGESLAEAICCDAYYRSLGAAEPKGTFAQQDLFREPLSEELTFYDSVCGKALFRVGGRGAKRSVAAFRNETAAHGWPSFREHEVLDTLNVSGNLVLSSCGTYLGTTEPDAEGQRYCLDLVCLSGHGQPAASAATLAAAPAATLAAAPAAPVTLLAFDGSPAAASTLVPMDDPVMGGQSHSAFSIQHRLGVWEGQVDLVPFLGKPGFCTARARTKTSLAGRAGIQIVARNAGGELTNFELHLGTSGSRVAGREGTFVANFALARSEAAHTVFLPWSRFVLSFRGQPLHGGPALEDELDSVLRVSLGTHGVAGKFRLELTSVAAVAEDAAHVTSVAERREFVLAEGSGAGDGVDLVTFDGAQGTSFSWNLVNDPVVRALLSRRHGRPR